MFGHLSKQICHQDLLKIAQSGHTGHTLVYNYYINLHSAR